MIVMSGRLMPGGLMSGMPISGGLMFVLANIRQANVRSTTGQYPDVGPMFGRPISDGPMFGMPISGRPIYPVG